ncbi:hypothetical protein DPM19_08810 [Actinomadura craniellae]|uniref:Uncharacterized protein n=1 Tax=Actinomadura craniellae TaxID=2231787 RepID=A0A365HC62_9ACTN|nr:hypothetical protein [Actinomadura craniellae]RAY15853.1 hypothetical protein DPM19_08810 [Actinomadura craniellae]
MRIPKRVNTAWDWAEANQRVLVVVMTLVIAALAIPWQPALAAFVVGLSAGGLLVHRRMARRATRLRTEIDDLLRENGALQHRNIVLSSGVLTSQALLTQRLPVIPDELEEAEEAGEAKGADQDGP